jgi:DNA modification methylase
MAGSRGKSIHGARTPHGIADWWIRYICPPGGTVLDPFMGVGSIGETALDLGRNYVGIERMKNYFDHANTTLPKRARRCEVDFTTTDPN